MYDRLKRHGLMEEASEALKRVDVEVRIEMMVEGGKK